jgi:DeoR/GlpR family transcriptional regulator of sugar metabolism
VGACAVDARAGVAAFDAEEAALKQAMVEASGGVAVAVTVEKLGTAAPHLVAPVSALTDLVVEADAAADVLDPLRACGVRVHVAGREGEA